MEWNGFQKNIGFGNMKNPDSFFMDIAKRTSEQSRCLSRKTGAVIVLGDDIVSVGFNGPPKNFPNPDTLKFLRIYINKFNFGLEQQRELEAGKCPRRIMGFSSGENRSFCVCADAEQNAIDNAAKLGRRTKDTIIYIWAEVSCCVVCATNIVNAGIKEVVMNNLDNYETSGFSGMDIFENCDIKVRSSIYG